MYLVTKRFISGVLTGLTVVDESSVPYVVGKEYKGILTSSRFIVDKCVKEA
jgi:hypothetical protein